MINFNGVLPPTGEAISLTDYGHQELSTVIENLSVPESYPHEEEEHTIDDLTDLLLSNGASVEVVRAIGEKIAITCIPEADAEDLREVFVAKWNSRVQEGAEE